jgi:hypothetical protein
MQKIFLLLITCFAFYSCSNSSRVWYVQPEFEQAWTSIVSDAPKPVMKIQIWENGELPPGPGIYIGSGLWQSQQKVNVYYRLSYDLEYQSAVVLALDPWMIFHKYRNPELTANRAYSDARGDGVLLIPGKNKEYVDAWIAKLIQESPGKFPLDERTWIEYENNLFSGNRFPNGARTYTLNDALFRLMSNENAWLYAPISVIRKYRDNRKAILEAVAFPEISSDGQYSLQARLLWALPLGTEKQKEKLSAIITWLKAPETQTIIADTLEWIPADPYGKPYDPMCMASQRNWLTSSYIYEVNE